MSDLDSQADAGIRKDINLLDYWLIVLKRKWLIAAAAFAALALAAAYSYTRTPIFTARGQLLIEREPNILTFEQGFQVETYQNDYYQTQYKLLQSRSLADRVVDRLNLHEHPEFVRRPGPGGKPRDKNNPILRSSLVSRFLGRLGISPVRQTRLVDITFRAADPKLAADGVNTLFDAFIDMNIERKFSATEQATEFLAAQIASMRSEIERKERQLQAYGADKNIVALSDKETTIIGKLAELNSALTQAQIDRINKEAYYNQIKRTSPDNIPEGMNNTLIQTLRGEYARLSREYAKKQEQFGPEYPEIQRLKTELDSAKSSLEAETRNLISAAYSDYQAALKRENSLQAVFNSQKNESIQLNSDAISYNTLKNEIDNNKTLLDNLLKRQSETGVQARLSGVGVSTIKIVDRAEVPRIPSSPRKKENMMLGLFLGLMGGLGLAFFIEYLDNTVKSAQDVERYSGLPTLGIVPLFDPKAKRRGYGYGYGASRLKTALTGRGGPAGAQTPREDPSQPSIKTIDLISYASPKSNFAESYRAIRTSVFLSSTAPGTKTFVVTSPLPSEGKSSTVGNLAVTMAQAGKRVLLIDADLRKPRQHKVLRVKNINGLTNYLTGGLEMKDLIKSTIVQNLFLINSGPVPPNPAELLGSERMHDFLDKLKQTFDYILIDTPPILAVTDALVIGSKTDGVILVVWGGKTAREALKRAKERLAMTSLKAVGVIINRLNIHEHDYYYKRHYYSYYHEGEV